MSSILSVVDRHADVSGDGDRSRQERLSRSMQMTRL